MSDRVRFNIEDLEVGDVVRKEGRDEILVVDSNVLVRILNGELRVAPIYLDDETLHQVLGSCGCVETGPYQWRLYLDSKGNEYAFYDWTIVKVFEGNKRCHDVVIEQCYYLHDLQHTFKKLRLLTDIDNGIRNFVMMCRGKEYYLKENGMI